MLQMTLAKMLFLMEIVILVQCILKIKNNTQHNTLFDFKPTDVDTVNKLVNKINIKKTTDVDQISSKLLRAGAPVLNKHITTLVNNTIKTSVLQPG
jgi:predicted transcriptional regulator